MSLRDATYLYIDCQTTGMRPSVGQVLEIAWCLGRPGDLAPAKIESRLVRLPEGESIPRAVAELTGIGDEDMKAAKSEDEVFQEFKAMVESAPRPLYAVIHYSNFEKPFLLDWFQRLGGVGELPFEILCSHRLCKVALPNLPSQNLRAAAGYFGEPVNDVNRAGSHVASTLTVWRGLCDELEKHGLTCPDQIAAWAKSKPKPAKGEKLEYRLEKIKRLELPDQPGVYRMLAKSGKVLYVGKATSLKSRVNSYFRGQKNRDRRKLEMLAQVWDLQVTTCNSPLEAALLENDEIKRLDPPYNVVFKRGDRRMSFYSRDFMRVSQTQSDEFPLGPFRGAGNLDSLRMLYRCIVTANFNLPIFYIEMLEEDLREGYALFLRNNNLSPTDIKGIRSLLAFGMNLFRHYDADEEAAMEALALENSPDETADETDEIEILTPENIAGKYERLMRRSAAEYRRARALTDMLDADVVWGPEDRQSELHLHHGQLRETAPPPPGQPYPWLDLDIETYDRLSILLSELNKHPHRKVCRRGQFSPFPHKMPRPKEIS